jgi:hypothetical protein
MAGFWREQSTQAELDAALARSGVSIMTTGVLGWAAIERQVTNSNFIMLDG